MPIRDHGNINRLRAASRLTLLRQKAASDGRYRQSVLFKNRATGVSRQKSTVMRWRTDCSHVPGAKYDMEVRENSTFVNERRRTEAAALRQVNCQYPNHCRMRSLPIVRVEHPRRRQRKPSKRRHGCNELAK